MPHSIAEELSAIPMSTHLGQSLERAHRFAREQSHRAVTLEHLLLALTEDAEAAVILQSANIELGRLSTEVSGYLGRLPEDMRGDGSAEPRPDAELLRVLPAAAAARARIQRRSAAGAARLELAVAAPVKPVAAPAEVDAEPHHAGEPADTAALTEAIEAAMAGTVVRGTEPAPAPAADPPARTASAPAAHSAPPPPPPVAQAAQPTWTPAPRPPLANRLPQSPPARPLPFPVRPVAAGEGPRRPPLPPSPSAAGQPQHGYPNRPPRAPWPELGERGGAAARPAHANGSFAEAPSAVARAPQAAWAPPTPRGSGQTEKGLLVESVPRRMRVGVPTTAEVRIARDRIDSLILALNGRGSAPHVEHSLTRALSVRLRAPGSDFWIESATPETQWVERAPSLIHDDYAIWRWSVVARRRGRGRLTLMVSARTIGRDGIAAETA